MELDELKTRWSNQGPPVFIDDHIISELASFNKALTKENKNVTYLFSGVIFIICSCVVPLLSSDIILVGIVGVMMLVMGLLSILFWMRSIHVKKSMIENPKIFLHAQIRKLKYNVFITNWIIPFYVLLIGLLSGIYMYRLLSPYSKLYWIVGLSILWVFLVFTFTISWSKQRAKDKLLILPKIESLETVLEGYEN